VVAVAYGYYFIGFDDKAKRWHLHNIYNGFYKTSKYPVKLKDYLDEFGYETFKVEAGSLDELIRLGLLDLYSEWVHHT
jgi:hypothetical protein